MLQKYLPTPRREGQNSTTATTNRTMLNEFKNEFVEPENTKKILGLCSKSKESKDELGTMGSLKMTDDIIIT